MVIEMKKIVFVSLVISLLVGCVNKDVSDVKNSPCACSYDGEPLQQPTPELIKEIADLQFS